MREPSECCTGPDLSHLDRDTRIRIAVAVSPAGGMRWERFADGWILRTAGGECAAILLNSGTLEIAWDDDAAEVLPRYLSDPAAWGALMEAEGIAVAPTANGGWWASWGKPGVASAEPRLGAAVCAAVLAKYGKEVG